MRKVGIVLVLVVAGWSAAWLYASGEAGRQVDGWIKAEATQGRIWTCPNRAIGGYPLAIAIACSDPTFSGRGLGQVVDGSLAGLDADVSLLHPRTVAITLRAPFTYKTSAGETDITGTWSTLHVSLGPLPAPRMLALAGTDVSVRGLFGQSGQQGGAAAKLDTAFTFEPDPANPTLAFTVAIDGMPIPSLDAVIGGSDPYSIALDGRLDRADVGDAKTPEDAMEQWRIAGGRIDLADIAHDARAKQGDGERHDRARRRAPAAGAPRSPVRRPRADPPPLRHQRQSGGGRLAAEQPLRRWP